MFLIFTVWPIYNLYVVLYFSDYYNSKDLHIGVTNSQGCVVEFSEEGIRGVDLMTKKWSSCDSSVEWDQCLLLEQFDELWNEIWDSVLLKVWKLLYLCNNSWK